VHDILAGLFEATTRDGHGDSDVIKISKQHQTESCYQGMQRNFFGLNGKEKVTLNKFWSFIEVNKMNYSQASFKRNPS